MDIKGAYLNGTLKETIYMWQPNGYEDDTNHVCKLIKTLYGLKQSGHKWNTEFDNKIKKHRFKCLRSEPYAYTQSENNKIVIITIWVDDLLLFANSAEAMERIKRDIHNEWKVTDLGKPTKIVGVEINQIPDQISISQKQNILKIPNK